MSIYANLSGDSREGIDAYTQALLDLVGDRDPLDLLPLLPERIAAAIEGLGEAQLKQREGEGKWSIAHVIRHLADSEIVSSFRFRMVIAHDTPEIASYDQDQWASRLHYEDADVVETLDLLRALRRANVRLLGSLTDEERQRGGMHSERGFESVERLMCLIAAHDIVHQRQIERIKSLPG